MNNIPQLWSAAFQAAYEALFRPGRLGREEADGSFTIDVPGKVKRVYVSMGSGRTTGVEEAINVHVPRLAGIPVRVMRFGRVSIVAGVDESSPFFADHHANVDFHVHNAKYGLPMSVLELEGMPKSLMGAAGQALLVAGDEKKFYLGNAPAGEPGADGASAYEIAVANGFVGTESEWLASLVGPEGDPGPPGDAADIVNEVDNATELTTPDAAMRFAATLSGALRWISWANILAALNVIFGRLAEPNIWTRGQQIAGSANEILLHVKAAAAQTTFMAYFQSNSGTGYQWMDSIGRWFGTAGYYFRNGAVALLGENTFDSTMTGMYDRNELANAALRGVVTVTLTGAGAYTNTVGNKNTLFDGIAGFGGFFEISGTDATTTGLVIHVDLLANQSNYFSVFWQPFVQYRLLTTAGFSGSYFAAVTVEVSANNVNWFKPVDGSWETTDVNTSQLVPGYWIGRSGQLPTINNWRYVRFTFSDRRENAAYASKEFIWISEIGLRHLSAPWSRHYAKTSGDNLYGDYRLVPAGAATSAYNTIIRQDGSAVFNEQGADVDFRIESDTDANNFVSDASADSIGIGVAAGSILAKLHVLISHATRAAFRATQSGAGAVAEFYHGAVQVLNIGSSGLAVNSSVSTSVSVAIAGAIKGYLFAALGAGNGSNVAIAGDYIVRAEAGNLIITARNATGDIIFATGTPDSQKAIIKSGGNAAFGVLVPRGRLDIHDGTTGWLHTTKTGVVGTEIDIIAAADPQWVTRGYSVTLFAYGSAGTKVRGDFGDDGFTDADTPAAGSVTLGFGFDVGSGLYRLTLRLYSSGRLTVQRTQGTESWNVSLKIMYQ